MVSKKSLLTIRSRSPLRISFAGGGTDVPPFPENEGGAVLSTTIDQYAYCTVESINKKGIIVESHDYKILQTYRKISELRYDGKLDLIKAHLKKLNNKNSIKLTISVDAPPGSGLGSSSAVSVALVGALQTRIKSSYDIAKLAYNIERNKLGIKGGMQDQYASAFGGFNLIEFKKDSVIVNPLRLRNEIMNELAASIVLCDTKKTRDSTNIIENQIDSYKRNDISTIEHLRKIKQLTYETKDALVKGDIISIANYLNEGWEYKKKIGSKISNKKLDKVYALAMQNGAIGGKLLGAGGGGHFLFISDPTKKPNLCKELIKKGFNIVKFNFDSHGLQTWTIKEGNVVV